MPMTPIQLVPIEKVRPSTYNPRETDPMRLDLIELSLRKLGFLLPMFSDAGGELLSGHQRQLVCERLHVTHVPVAYTPAFPLSQRKAINIAFNRGTNDLKPEDTPENMTDALLRASPHKIAETMPDVPLNSDRFFRCMSTERTPIGPYLESNSGRWVPYARNIANTLRGYGIVMPIIALPDRRIVNGIGRLQLAAEKGDATIDVLTITPEEAALSDAMLNLLSMDFDLHRRYADLLRYNSFRRERQQTRRLGQGFTQFVKPNKPSYELDIYDADDRAAWVAKHGRCVVDFGAGHLMETHMLRENGVTVAAFEPFRCSSDVIDVEASRQVAREFLEYVAKGTRFDSVFISSVLNSVPFHEDRRAIVAITHAVCGKATRLYATATAAASSANRQASGASQLDQIQGATTAFRLSYEKNIRIGDISETPKVQKFFSQRDFYDLFIERFEAVKTTEFSAKTYAECWRPKPVVPAELARALEFEFDLPYPDGQRMGLVAEAKAAFSARLGVKL